MQMYHEAGAVTPALDWQRWVEFSNLQSDIDHYLSLSEFYEEEITLVGTEIDQPGITEETEEERIKREAEETAAREKIAADNEKIAQKLKEEKEKKEKAKEDRIAERQNTWNILSGIGIIVMMIVIIDLWCCVKENSDKITPYYLQKTKKQISKEKEDEQGKKERRALRA